jgi:hypothetical protein
MRREQIGFEFVEFIPNELEERILYVSPEYAVTAHLCCCGCGLEVSLPLAPAEWKLTFDGRISLSPSIGRSGSPCESHYWIRDGRVGWAEKLSPATVRAHTARAEAARASYYDTQDSTPADGAQSTKRAGRWERIKHFFSC